MTTENHNASSPQYPLEIRFENSVSAEDQTQLAAELKDICLEFLGETVERLAPQLQSAPAAAGCQWTTVTKKDGSQQMNILCFVALAKGEPLPLDVAFAIGSDAFIKSQRIHFEASIKTLPGARKVSR